MFKRKQWASAVRRGRKHHNYDDAAALPIGSVAKDKEEPSGRREDEPNKKMKIMKRTRKRKKRDYCSVDVTSQRPSPLEEFNDSDIDCDNEKENHVHCCSASFSPEPSMCCHHDNKDTSKYNYDEYSSISDSSSSPSHSPIYISSSPDGRRKKKGKHINNNKRVGKNLTHKRLRRVVKKERRGGGKRIFSKRTKRSINLMAAAGIKFCIALLL